MARGRRQSKRGGGGGQRRKQAEDVVEWTPITRLGKLVKEGQVKSMDEALVSGLPIKETEIVDALLPGLEDEVLEINMVQRMTDSGRRVKFRATVIVGNGDGYLGIGVGKDVQVGVAIGKAIADAKKNIIKIKRGCGSWECGCEGEHTVPFQVEGKSSSVRIRLLPAPRGLGISSGDTARKVMELAGIKDVWTHARGDTRTKLNFARATYNALFQTTLMKGG